MGCRAMNQWAFLERLRPPRGPYGEPAQELMFPHPFVGHVHAVEGGLTGQSVFQDLETNTSTIVGNVQRVNGASPPLSPFGIFGKFNQWRLFHCWFSPAGARTFLTEPC